MLKKGIFVQPAVPCFRGISINFHKLSTETDSRHVGKLQKLNKKKEIAFQ